MTRVITGDLGWCVARLEIDEQGLADTLHILSPADTSANRYAPCESVCLVSRPSLVKLQAFLDQHIIDTACATKEAPCP